MIADLRPYAEYRASSGAWFGEVPSHWSVLPNRAVFTEVKDRNHPHEELLSVTIRRGVIRQQILFEGSSKKDSSNLDKSAYKLVRPGDLSYNKMRAWQGAIGASTLRGIVSPAYVVMRPRTDDCVPEYLHHLYRTPLFAKEAERWSYGITSDMWSLRPEHFKMIYTPLPPPAEQAAIVRFLSWANGRLDRAIRAKRKVIALLNEQKQAIIHRAVTRGFDPAVLLKPSGIPWVGDAPVHWSIEPLKRLIQSRTTISYGIVQPGEHLEGGVAFLQTTNISGSSLSAQQLQRTSVAIAAAYPRTRLTTGDVILGIRASIGAAHVVPSEFEGMNLSRGIARIVPNDELSSDYLVLFLRSRAAAGYWDYVRQGTTFNEVAISAVRLLPVLLPPRSEQADIVAEANRRSKPVDAAISRLEHEMDLLREYSLTIVADVVTGKLDVREPAAYLADETRSNDVQNETRPMHDFDLAGEDAIA